MSLADALAAELAPKPKPCAFARLLATLADDDVAALQAFLDSRAPKYSSARIAGVLNTNGYSVSEGSIQNHRVRNCGCFRA